MTVTTNAPGAGAEAPPPTELVTVTIDDVQVQVPKGTLIIRAAERIGVQIPRFCDHPLLDPAGACRQCIVEVEGQRKPVASCTMAVADGMVVRTQVSSPAAASAQRGVMELLLINHPLDCPVCDKGGECPLQNQAISSGRADSRFEGPKRTFPKPIPLSSQVLLDRERCVQCARCTRFSAQIAGDPFIELVERGAQEQVGIAEGEEFRSYFSGNTIQICPVGALTSAAYRFRSRPFDLTSSPGVCEHCASGCAIRTDHRRGKTLRRMAFDDPSVNEEWNCDKGRFGFRYAQAADRIRTPLVRDAATRAGERGELRPASWPEALEAAARGLTRRPGGGDRPARAAVLAGGRATVEDAYGYAKFARTVLGTNDVDFRARAHSPEEADFLGAVVAGRGIDLDGNGVAYADLEAAPAVLLAGFEPEEESPIVFLRLRKAVRKRGLKVFSIATHASRGLDKLGGRLLPAAPGTETEWLDALSGPDPLLGGPAGDDAGETVGAASALAEPGAVILVGERLAGVPGAYTAVCRLARSTGARPAWVPRRAGERGAVEAGALPGLLPGGRPVTDPEARERTAEAWGLADSAALPSRYGRDTGGILAAAANGDLDALLVGAVDPDDLPDPAAADAALDRVGFLVSLELRTSAVTERADVVLPVAAAQEKAGTFLDWEGRVRMFDPAIRPDQLTARQLPPDLRVLHMLADAAGVPLGLPDVSAARRELDSFGRWTGERVDPPTETSRPLPRPAAGEALLGGWRQLLDNGTLQDGDPALAGTRHPVVARLSPATAAEVGVADGAQLAVSGPAGAVDLPLAITPELPDRVVWVPQNSTPGGVHRALGVVAGRVVGLAPAVGAGAAVAAGTVNGSAGEGI
jgi:NADH-quinone oxidoreductase subunit G